MKRAWMAVLVAATGLSISAGASAQEGLAPGRLDPSFKGLAFGGTRDQVLEVLKKRVQERYGAMIRDTLDVRDRDRLTHEMQKEIDDIVASKIAFDGTQTGWNVSILRDEFVNGQGIEMTRVREGNARYYFFFVNGVFYKMIETPADPAREPAMKALEASYGKPTKVEWIDTKKTRLDRAEWTPEDPLSLELKDYTRQFQTVMIRWALKEKDKPIQALVKKAEGTRPALNPLIQEAQAPEDNPGREPADDVIGTPAPGAKKPADKPKKHKK